MELLAFRILATISAFVLVAGMVWDQCRHNGMTPFKWALIPAMLVLLAGNAWLV